MVSFSLKLFRTFTTSEVLKVMSLSETAIRIPPQISNWPRDVASEAPDLNQEGSSIQKSHRDFPPFKAVKQIAGNYAGSFLQNIQECQTSRRSVRQTKPQWLVSARLQNTFFFCPTCKSPYREATNYVLAPSFYFCKANG